LEDTNLYQERLEDLSVFYFLSDTFSDVPFVTIVDGFPESDLVIPTISVEAGRTDVVEYEIGNRDGRRVRRWYIDIYALNKAQRDDFGYRLLDVLKNGIPVYNYDEGFPPTVSPSKIGVLKILSKSMDPIKVSADISNKLYYMATIQIVAYNDVI